MRTELAEMRNTLDKNMVYVTHDQVEAMTLGDRIVVMAYGLVQQEGTAEQLFKSPANKFVAGFIGSPTMNFLDAELVEKNGVLTAQGDAFCLNLPSSMNDRVKLLSSRQVTIGIRPSCFKLPSASESEGSQITLLVKVSEYLGAQSILVTRCGAQDLLVEMESSSPVAGGHNMTFSVDAEDIMVFDKKSELRL